MGYLFFFSYASVDLTYDSNEYIKRFFRDLSNRVRQLSFDIPDQDAFMDKGSLATGDRWEPAIGQALQTSRAFVCMCSGNYFVSEYCGKELELFRQRIDSYKAGALPPDASVPLIFPVLWDAPGDMPDALSALQFNSGGLPDRYARDGLFSIMLDGSDAQATYNKVYDALARGIHDNLARFPDLPHLDPFPPLREVRSAWEPEAPPVAPPVAPPAPPGKPPPRPPGDPLAAWADILEPSLRQALEEALDLAAERGVVTSIDLLVALLSAPGSQIAEAIDHAKVDRAAFLAFLRSMLKDASAGSPPSGLGLSETVTKALSAAKAARKGDELISVRDLEAGLATVGGGTAAQVLEALEISLADLTAEREPTADELPESLFDDDQKLQSNYLDDSTRSALNAASAFAKSRGEMISTYALFVGFALADSGTLRDALGAQGEQGTQVIEALFGDARPETPQTLELSMSDFSANAWKALEESVSRARSGGSSSISDADVLRELLREREREVSVRTLLERLGVEPGALSSSLR